ncbi:LLM class flavin-dependent oxidoreductase [Rhizobium sp. ZPR3]|uniref:LLM class flavin-dependent oxidoreductase n=2 Tax=unclassified Rhizobium TaxID=2613769 RepID=A0AAU7SR94_9HYPH
MTDRAQMTLALFLNQTGHHEAGWRYPTAFVDGGANFGRYLEQAKLAEHAAFHFLFVPDSAGIRETRKSVVAHVARNDSFEPITLMSALAVTTKNVGLVATATTTYNEPYHIARKFASLDHLSNGRAGWNIVTSSNPLEALNFSHQSHPGHDDRYARAHEFLEVVTALWDSWEDNAFPRDKLSGVYADISKLHFVEHTGERFKVRGPLNIARPVQGHPVLVQAGTSTAGLEFAAKYGEVIFTAMQSPEEARNYYDRIKTIAVGFGRKRTDLVVMPGIVPIVGQSEREARERLDVLQSLTHYEVGVEMANQVLGGVVDLRDYEIDAPLPTNLVQTELMKGRQKILLQIAGERKLTIGGFIDLVSVGRGHNHIVGTATQVADRLQFMFDQGIADGFNVMPAVLPDDLSTFCCEVVPILQDRGLFRRGFVGDTLRDNLQLGRPESRFKEISNVCSAQ